MLVERVCVIFLCFRTLQQLLCLLLQCLACIALTPGHHQALSDADISDMLMQLLLPSDEWYYTNHSTKYAKFVKYHAARILVYMGMLHKLGGRVDLFDRRRKFRLFLFFLICFYFFIFIFLLVFYFYFLSLKLIRIRIVGFFLYYCIAQAWKC